MNINHHHLLCYVVQKENKRNEKEKFMKMSSTSDINYDSLKDDFKKKLIWYQWDYAHIEGEKVEIEIKKVDAKIKAESVEEGLKMDDLQILSKD